jgi:hypothetical protein
MLDSPGRRLSPATMPAEDHGPEADSRDLRSKTPRELDQVAAPKNRARTGASGFILML